MDTIGALMLDSVDEPRTEDPSYTRSTLRERIVAQLFIGDLLRHLWRNGLHDVEVLHPAIDAHGYDVVISLGGVTRHVQLKTVAGKNKKFGIHTGLEARESACVIVIVVDPKNLRLGPYLFYGGGPGERLPPIGHYPIAKHAKGDSTGYKRPRPRQRELPLTAFKRLNGIAELCRALFGDHPSEAVGTRAALSPSIAENILSHLPRQEIIDAFARSPGNELDSKFASEESSAALAANTFGLFLDQPELLPPLPNTMDLGWPAKSVCIEACVRFPWAGGRHPWLDALIETETRLIGVESKRYEPYRAHNAGSFSDAYQRDEWGLGMKPFEAVRDGLHDGGMYFKRLDAAQLVKHALGLRTEAHRRGKAAALLYLYAEPELWFNKQPVDPHALEEHAREARHFARLVEEAEVEFRLCTYKELLAAFKASGNTEVERHATEVAKVFRL
jgi:hypothetical protein